MIKTGRYLDDFQDKWISMDTIYPPKGVIVAITDADRDGFADFVFHCYLDGDNFYDKDGIKTCAAYTVSYWKRID